MVQVCLNGTRGAADGTAVPWPVLRLAGRLGLATRIGLEDTLVLPDGRRALSNAQLVTAALHRYGCARRPS
ncbi:3-keto-5-aminohexanoate cleavage protein [Streptomyces sp. NPDC088812]|uniref:3-keto-5-aminohexanoate cleavage protein n=1 Tax=Streptomyces sp. NPDC088812 TaxID=3365905 RepID=UPI0037F584F5